MLQRGSEKGNFRYKCRLLRGGGGDKGMLQKEKGERKFQNLRNK